MAKFLVVHPNLDIYGGGERVCHYIIKALATHGQKVDLLTFEFDEKRYEQIIGEEFPAGVTVHRLGKRPEVKPPFTVYKRRRNIIKLLKKFRENLEYDYLFSTQSFSPFEVAFLDKAKKNIAYVHFPEIHFDYDHSGLTRKVYLWLFKRWVEQGIKELDVIFCNSNYTKGMIERYWGPLGVPEPTVIYPPVNLDAFWCNTPLEQRPTRVTYVGRFIPQKKHELMKQLAVDLPDYEFVSIGGLRDTEEAWFQKFAENIPKNYILKPNLSGNELIKTLQDSRIYTHLMQGEHFGIAPMEALASGCITLVHNSGGTGEFIPEKFRWENYDDLKNKVAHFIEADKQSIDWNKERDELWSKLSILTPKNFEEKIWSKMQELTE